MGRSKLGISIALLACALACGALVGASAHDSIALRRKIMKAVGSATKVASEMARGQRNFDAAAASSEMRLVARSWPELAKLFPKGSESGGQTRATAEIWQQFDDFDAKGQEMVVAARKAAEAAAQGPDAFNAAFREVAKTCKSCHRLYMTRD